MLLVGYLLVAGTIYVGQRIYEFLDASSPPKEQALASRDEISKEKESGTDSSTLVLVQAAEINKHLTVAVTGLGLAVVGTVLYPPAILGCVLCTLYNVLDFIRTAHSKWVEKQTLGIELVEVIAIIGGLSVGAYGLSSLTDCLYYVAARFRLQAKGRLQARITNIFQVPQGDVWVLSGEAEFQIPLADVKAGDVLVVSAGEVIPVDGIIVRGAAAIDQQALTGEAQMAERIIGDKVLASTMVITGRIYVHAQLTGKETATAYIETLLQETESFVQSLELRSEVAADATVKPTLVVGAATMLLQGPLIGGAVIASNYSSVSRLTSPWMLINYLELAASRRLLIKDGRSLESISQVSMVVFDKTGTLTLGRLEFVSIHPLTEAATDEYILHLAATVEQRQTHVIARAILQEAEHRGISISPITDPHYELGHGIRARLGEAEVLVGSERFLSQQGIVVPMLPAHDRIKQDCEDRGNTLVYVAADRILFGALELQPTIRPEALDTIRRLKARGLSICIVSGDNAPPTRALAKVLGIDRYTAGALPQDKARIVAELQAEGHRVCMVGDGMNDAVALRRATVSVSLSSASVLATDSAEIILMDDTLHALDDLFELGNTYARTQQIGTALSITPGVLVASAVFLGFASLPAAFVGYLATTAVGVSFAQLAIWKQKRELARLSLKNEPPEIRALENGSPEIRD